jgi:hypothetical protein
MSDPTAIERMQRYRQRKRDEAQRHSGKVQLRNIHVTPAAHAMLALLAEQYGDASGAAEEAIRRLHAAHYRAVSDTVTVTSRSDRAQSAPRGRVQEPGKAARRADLVRRIKQMHGEGLGASAIAARLNREGEATLSGVGQWRHKAVQALLDEADR